MNESKWVLKEVKPGDLFANRYDIAERVGKGGMGAVFRAYDRALDEFVALKILAPVADVSEELIRLFRQEVKLSRRITHPNVVRVYDIGECDGQLYMTMELIVGTTLRQATLAASGHLPVSEVLRIGEALADGLAAVHTQEIIHRDLKPANIMLEDSGRVMLMDFGIASQMADGQDKASTAGLGTIRYMAPEQLLKRTLDPRTDIYAFGLVLLETLNGELPPRVLHDGLPSFDPGTVCIMQTTPAPNPVVVAELEALIRRCLKADPRARPESALEIRQQLAQMSGSLARPNSFSGPLRPVAQSQPDAHRIPWATLAGNVETSGIAVLPFGYAGSNDYAYLGVTLADELANQLAQNPSLRVLGTSATAALANSRDFRALGQTLGVVLILDGSLSMVGERGSMIVRLVDATRGQLMWTELHEGSLADLMAFQPVLIRRIAADLRMELTAHAIAPTLPAGVVDDYLAARRDMRINDGMHLISAFERFDRCVTQAPDFLPAVTGRATSATRAWFWDRYGLGKRDWESTANEAVDRAMTLAPSMPETHLVAGMLAAQRCEMHRAARYLTRALQLAPTYVEAHEYLGLLQAEADKLEEAHERFVFAAYLDPSRPVALIQQARYHALHRDYARAERILDEADGRIGSPGFGSTVMRMRAAGWRGGIQPLQLSPTLEAALQQEHWYFPALYADVVRGKVDAQGLAQRSNILIQAARSPRIIASVGQMCSEMWLLLGYHEPALKLLSQVADTGFIDVVWLEHCPLVETLWQHAEMQEIHHKVRARADAMWM